MADKMGDSGAVRFRVFKGSKFLFECEIACTDTLPATLRQQVVRVDEFGLLRNVDLSITKRLNLVEVDRMIACCRIHPPQAVATPIVEYGAHENQAAFEDFAAYLKQRERAGVAALSTGVLVLLIPIMGRNNYMQCQIVNTTSTVGEIGAQVLLATPREIQPVAVEAATTVATLSAHDEDVVIKEEVPSEVPSPTATRAQALADGHPAIAPDPSHPQEITVPVVLPAVANGAAAHQELQCPEANRRTNDDTRIAKSSEDRAPHDVDMVDAPDLARNEVDKQTEVEPEPEQVDLYAALRQEYDAFNAFYHHVLLEWSTKPSDIDSATELRRQALL